MKKVLVIIVIILILALVVGVICFNKNKDGNSSKGNVANPGEEVVAGVREVKTNNTNFDKELGFSIEKGNEVKNIKYDTIFLHGNDQAQLDLILDNNGKIGTLIVSKIESSSSEEVENLLISETSVSKEAGIDGIDTYSWEKEGFYYKFSTKNDSGVTIDDVAKIIEGYNVKVAEEDFEE